MQRCMAAAPLSQRHGSPPRDDQLQHVMRTSPQFSQSHPPLVMQCVTLLLSCSVALMEHTLHFPLQVATGQNMLPAILPCDTLHCHAFTGYSALCWVDCLMT